MGPLELLILVLVIAWITGAFIVPIGGSLIHLLLVVLLVVVLFKVLRHDQL